MTRRILTVALVVIMAAAIPRHAHAAALDGAALRWPWALPFAECC